MSSQRQHQDQPVYGRYMHPVISEEARGSDPWQRIYNQPPPLHDLVPRIYPLTDIRPLLAKPAGQPARLLKSHGFGVVKHQSALISQLSQHSELPEGVVKRLYHEEMRELVRKITGATRIFIGTTIHRQGKRTVESYPVPTGLSSTNLTASGCSGGESEDGNEDTHSGASYQNYLSSRHKLSRQPGLTLSSPVRIPHLDATPLGARQMVRAQDQHIFDAAVDSGVVAAEDEICKAWGVSARRENSNLPISRYYNKKGKLGPRYSAYSVWRPLVKVKKDPLTLSPRGMGADTSSKSVGSGDVVYWPYMNKIRGTEQLGGDFLCQFALLGSISQDSCRSAVVDHEMKWYYVSEQRTDEVLFIKLFDSASLGEDAEHAPAPWHASPEIDFLCDGRPRESIELRVLAFW